MGIGDAFLGAQLLADALQAAGESDLDAALSGYREEHRKKTDAVFDYTAASAALKDPTPQVPLYRAITARSDLSQHLMNVLGGSVSFRSLFNARVLAEVMPTATGR